MQVISLRPPRLKQGLIKFLYFNFYLHIGLLIMATLAGNAKAASPPDRTQYEIALHQAIEIALPENVSSAVLANPDIADILVQTRASIVVSGKKLGTTNLLLRDRDQRTILDIELNIATHDARSISIFTGSIRTDYSCLDSCRKSTSSADGSVSSSANALSQPPAK